MPSTYVNEAYKPGNPFKHVLEHFLSLILIGDVCPVWVQCFERRQLRGQCGMRVVFLHVSGKRRPRLRLLVQTPILPRDPPKTTQPQAERRRYCQTELWLHKLE